MSKVFIAFQFRGENEERVEKWLNIIKNEVIRRKKDYFCSFWHENEFKRKGYTAEQMYNFCLNELKKCKTVVFLIRSEKDSQGMKIELDYAVERGKKIIVIIKQALEFVEYRKKADYLFEIKDINELKDKIREIKV